MDIRIRDKSNFYVRRIHELGKLISAYHIPGLESFAKVEEELYLIRGDNIINNPLFGKIRMIFYNLCSFHYSPKAYTKRSIEKWFSEITEELIDRNCLAVYSFLKWIVEDLKNGSAMTGGHA